MANSDVPAFSRCSLPTDAASNGVIRHLREQGLLCADHRLLRDDREVVVLRSSEILLLEQSGIAVNVIAELSNDVPPGGDRASADALSTGFVSSYLDSPGIDAAYADLHAQFAALTTFTDLPEVTAGYDGTAPGLAGPSPVKLFRITTTPATFSKPALLIVAGLHAREWAPPLAAIEFASQLLHNYDPGSADSAILAVNALVEGLDILIGGWQSGRHRLSRAMTRRCGARTAVPARCLRAPASITTAISASTGVKAVLQATHVTTRSTAVRRRSPKRRIAISDTSWNSSPTS